MARCSTAGFTLRILAIPVGFLRCSGRSTTAGAELLATKMPGPSTPTMVVRRIGFAVFDAYSHLRRGIERELAGPVEDECASVLIASHGGLIRITLIHGQLSRL